MTSDFVSIPWSEAQAHRVIGAGGTALRLYRMEGGRRDGPPLLVGHCNGFSAGCYLRLLRELSATHDVFAFDHRGQGGSQAFDAEAGAELAALLAQDVARVVDAVAAARPDAAVHFVGHSLSAAALLQLAAEAPSRFVALPLAQAILIEPPVFPDAGHELFAECTASTIELLARTRRRRRSWASPAAYAAALRGRGPFAAFAEGMLDQLAVATLRPLGNEYVLACAPEMEAAVFATWGRPILYPALGRIPDTTPMTLVGGDAAMPGRDWVTAMMASVAQRMAHVVFETMRGYGHLWPFEAPSDAVSFLTQRVAGNLQAKSRRA